MEITRAFSSLPSSKRKRILELLQEIDQELGSDCVVISTASLELPLEIWITIDSYNQKDASALGALRRTCGMLYRGLPGIEKILDKKRFTPWIRRFCYHLVRNPNFGGEIRHIISSSYYLNELSVEIQQRSVPWKGFSPLCLIDRTTGLVYVDANKLLAIKETVYFIAFLRVTDDFPVTKFQLLLDSHTGGKFYTINLSLIFITTKLPFLRRYSENEHYRVENVCKTVEVTSSTVSNYLSNDVIQLTAEYKDFAETYSSAISTRRPTYKQIEYLKSVWCHLKKEKRESCTE